MNALIRLFYALFIAGSVIACITLGTRAFYQGPKYPDYPMYYGSDQSQYEKQQKTFDQKVKDYDKANKKYEHNTAAITLPIAVVVAIAGIYLFKRSDIIGEGITLGGLGGTIYAVTYASLAGAKIVELLALAALLLGAVAIAHNRFPVEKS